MIFHKFFNNHCFNDKHLPRRQKHTEFYNLFPRLYKLLPFNEHKKSALRKI